MSSSTKRKLNSSCLSPAAKKAKSFKDNRAPRKLVYRIGDDDSHCGKRFRTPVGKGKKPRIPIEVREDILNKYLVWKASGGRKSGKLSPVADILKKYKVSKNYPDKLLKKFKRDKSLLDTPQVGRPKVYGSPTKNDILRVAEE